MESYLIPMYPKLKGSQQLRYLWTSACLLTTVATFVGIAEMFGAFTAKSIAVADLMEEARS